MELLELILPTTKNKEQVEKYKQQLLEYASSFDGCGPLKSNDFDTWLKKCNDWNKGKNLPENFVPTTQYLCIRKTDNKLIGMLQLRHHLNDFILNYCGHIGYSIVPNERKKGYGKKILALGLKECKKLGINKVLVVCRETNTPSRKCILANGGEYEDTKTRQIDNVTLERYWINIEA